MTRDVDVLVVGAGLSGIGAAHRLAERCPSLSFAVLEARQAVGGTWDLFRYPGIRSDSDIHTFSFGFKPWRGDQALADGPGIKAYLEEAVVEFGLADAIHFGRRVESMAWSSATARWTVRTAEGEVWTCRWLHHCTGYYDYRRPHDPQLPGIDAYAGTVVHPQSWPDDLDVTGRRVVVIGSGATAVTVVPALAGTAAQVTMLQRSPTWMAALSNTDPVARALQRRLPDGLAHRLVRAKNLAFAMAFYEFCRAAPRSAARLLTTRLAGSLGAAAVAEHFTPRYRPWDQRMCVMPDGDLVAAVQRGDAAVVTDTITGFEPDGIRLGSGAVLGADVVVTATGLRLRALGGARLEVDGEPVDVGGRTAYRGVMLSGVPNLSMVIGYANNSWTLRADLANRWVCRMLAHLWRGRLAYAVPQRPGPPGTLPLIGLRSNYVLRSIDDFPGQGERVPWRFPQNYLVDSVQMTLGSVTTDMRFVRLADLPAETPGEAAA